MSFWRKLGRGFKRVGNGAASVAPVAIPLAAAAVSPQLGNLALQLLNAAEVSTPGRGRGDERLKHLRQSLLEVAPSVGVEIARVAGRPVTSETDLRLALEHHTLYIQHLEKAYAGEAQKPA